MNKIHALICMWSLSLFVLSAQTNLEPKAKQHFLDNNWREAAILFELIHKTQHQYADQTNYGRAIVTAFFWTEGHRLEHFYRIARNDSLSFEQIINLSDRAMNDVKKGNVMSELLFQLIDLENSISNQFWNAIISYLTEQREYEKAYRSKLKQVERGTITNPDRLILAHLALCNNRTDVAFNYYKEILSTDPFLAEANIGLGSILFVRGKTIYDNNPHINQSFISNYDEDNNRLLFLSELFDSYFRPAKEAFMTALANNKNHYTEQQLSFIEEIRKEIETRQNKLRKIDKYKSVISHKKSK